MRPSRLPLLALALLLAQCKVSVPEPAPLTPLEQLPAATQTGARTFGCLLNGQAWTPAGNPFAAPVFAVEVNKNRLGVSCRRSFNDAKGVPVANQLIEFAIDSAGQKHQKVS